MDPVLVSGFMLVGMLVIVFALGRFLPQPRQTCNRCSGSGQVNERWPDPSEPGGWHIVEGTCPKCKGKGKIALR